MVCCAIDCTHVEKGVPLWGLVFQVQNQPLLMVLRIINREDKQSVELWFFCNTQRREEFLRNS
jgi:hypothetical protein